MTILMKNPNFLILDEPTSGLDPNQLVDIRKLILEIGKTKTVMLSTHIMQEVEAICDRVIIIKEGKIVADNTTEGIQKIEQEKQTIFVEFDDVVSRNQLRQIEGVSSVKNIQDNQWLFASEGDIRSEIAKWAQKNSALVITMRLEEKGMEEVFKELTKN